MIDLIRKTYPFVKRMIDMVGAIVLLALLSLPMMVIWIAVRLTSKGPGLFWSERVGQNGRVFLMPKFRTMTVDSKVMSRELAKDGDCQLTPIGGFLRRASLDELPQFLSVLCGDMSFIGPRPVLPQDEAAQIRSSCARTLSVRPGITGLAQVNGRNFVTPRRKCRYDKFYAHNMCMILDVKIALRTLGILHRADLVK